MTSEVDDLIEHLQRYRGATLRTLEMVDDGDLAWRPGSDQYSLGQHLLHIAQAEDLYSRGLFDQDWNHDRVRFPDPLPPKAEILAFFQQVRDRTLSHLKTVAPEQLGQVVVIPGSEHRLSLRSWLWFMVEHEMHHKAQAAVYLRLMGRIPPFYAMPLEPGDRPDIAARQELGGFQGKIGYNPADTGV